MIALANANRRFVDPFHVQQDQQTTLDINLNRTADTTYFCPFLITHVFVPAAFPSCMASTPQQTERLPRTLYSSRRSLSAPARGGRLPTLASPSSPNHDSPIQTDQWSPTAALFPEGPSADISTEQRRNDGLHPGIDTPFVSISGIVPSQTTEDTSVHTSNMHRLPQPCMRASVYPTGAVTLSEPLARPVVATFHGSQETQQSNIAPDWTGKWVHLSLIDENKEEARSPPQMPLLQGTTTAQIRPAQGSGQTREMVLACAIFPDLTINALGQYKFRFSLIDSSWPTSVVLETRFSAVFEVVRSTSTTESPRDEQKIGTTSRPVYAGPC